MKKIALLSALFAIQASFITGFTSSGNIKHGVYYEADDDYQRVTLYYNGVIQSMFETGDFDYNMSSEFNELKKEFKGMSSGDAIRQPRTVTNYNQVRYKINNYKVSTDVQMRWSFGSYASGEKKFALASEYAFGYDSNYRMKSYGEKKNYLSLTPFSYQPTIRPGKINWMEPFGSKTAERSTTVTVKADVSSEGSVRGERTITIQEGIIYDFDTNTGGPRYRIGTTSGLEKGGKGLHYNFGISVEGAYEPSCAGSGVFLKLGQRMGATNASYFREKYKYNIGDWLLNFTDTAAYLTNLRGTCSVYKTRIGSNTYLTHGDSI